MQTEICTQYRVRDFEALDTLKVSKRLASKVSYVTFVDKHLSNLAVILRPFFFVRHQLLVDF